MIVYISGAIQNSEKPYKEKFQEAHLHLETLGHSVLDPSFLPSDLPLLRYMPICLAMLEQADAIYMLSDFRNSEGSMLELDYAMYQGKKVLFE